MSEGSLELPPLRSSVDLDLGPISDAFLKCEAKAREFKRDIEATLGDVGKGLHADPLADMRKGFDAMRDRLAGVAKSHASTGAGGAGMSSLFAGAGAIGIASGAGNILDDLSKKAERLAIELNKGPDAARKAKAEFLTALPIVGKLADSFDRFRALATGEAQYVAKIREATAAQEAHMKVVGGLHALMDDFGRDTEKIVDSINAKIERLQLHGLSKALFQAGRGELAEYNQVAADLENARRSDRANASRDAMAAANKNVGDLQQRYSDASAGGGGDVFDLRKRLGTAKAEAVSAKADFNRVMNEIEADARQRVNAIGRSAFQDKGAALFKSAADAAGNLFKPFVDSGAEARRKIAGDTADMAGMIQNASDELKKSGMTEEQKAVSDFKKHGPDLTQSTAFQNIQDKLHNVRAGPQIDSSLDDFFGPMEKDFQNASADADRFRDSLKGPVDRYNDLISQIRKFREEHLLTAGELDKLATKAKSDLDKSTTQFAQAVSPIAPQLPAFLRAGSGDSARLTFILSQGRDGTDLPIQQLAETKKQTAVQLTQAEKLSSIDSKLNFAAMEGLT